MSQNVVYPVNSCVFHPSRLKKVSLTQHGIAVGRMYLRRGASVPTADFRAADNLSILVF